MMGCAASYSYHNNTDTTYPSKSEDCDFQIKSSNPGPDYVEIGIIAVKFNLADRSGNPIGTSDPIEFKEKIRKIVCQAGGDIVVGEVNGNGQYVRGTVFRKKSGIK